MTSDAVCATCGKSAGATTPDGTRLCNDHAGQREQAEFLAHSGGEPFFGYLSMDGRMFTAWPGHELARITSYNHTSAGFGGWQRAGGRIYLRAVDAKGRHWHGNAAGRGMWGRLRLVKADQ